MKKNKSKIMTKKDYIILAIITIIYSIISFINLGSTTNPQTFYKFNQDEAITIKLNSIDDIIRIRTYTGEQQGEYAIYTSFDNIEYKYIKTINGDGAFSWNEEKILERAKYVKLVATIDNSSIGEIALYNNAKEYIKIEDITSTKSTNLKSLYDEKNAVPETISYLNSSYFDEIYFARTAYNYKEKQDTYEWTHPPLGKLIQSLPVIAFDNMSPFFYRLMGNIAGIIMVIIIYIFSKAMIKNTYFAAFSAILLCFDTLHFSQTRMGTTDSFLVLFMMLAMYFMYQYITKEKDKYDLLFSGICFGLSVCVKWTGALIGIPLAIMYFINIIKAKKDWKLHIIKGTLFFVIIPIVLYATCYLIYPKNQVTFTNSIGSIIQHSKSMYEYHSNLDATHPYSSAWYTWPISYKPVWYYTERYPNDIRGTIVGVGNVVIWWVSIIATIYLLYKTIKKKDKKAAIILLTILSLWLPYIFIGRVMFLYHYFPVLPFLILATTILFKDITKLSKTKIISIAYIMLVVVFFIVYYPVVSGLPVSNQYIESLRLLSSWYF